MCMYQDITNRWLTNGKPLKNDRMYFIDDVLYSYGRHYPLARIIRESKLVLINSNKSSPTTNRHKQIVERELISNYPMLNVPQPLASLETNLQILRDNLQSAIDIANRRMIKPNMLAVGVVADDFDALAKYMGMNTNIINTKVYTDYLTLTAAYKAKRERVKS